MLVSNHISDREIDQILELLGIKNNVNQQTTEREKNDSDFLFAWNFGEKPDDCIYSSTTDNAVHGVAPIKEDN